MLRKNPYQVTVLKGPRSGLTIWSRPDRNADAMDERVDANAAAIRGS